MSDEDFTDRVEATIVGVLQFAMRLIRTLVALVAAPGRLLAAVRSGFQDKRYIPPHTFLLSCAIATGLFGKVVNKDFTQGGPDIVGQFKDLNLASFLDHSVPVFLIAVAATLLADIFLRQQQVEQRQTFKRLHFYVIGFFGIGGLFLLLLLGLFLKLAFDPFGVGNNLFIYGSSTAIVGYILALLGLLYWLTSHAIRGPDGGTLAAGVAARILIIDLVVVVLCAVNFVRPYNQSGDGDDALQGRIVDVTKLPDDTLRLTFLLNNSGDADAVVSRVDKASLVLKEKPAGTLDSYDARFCASGQQGKPESGFLLLAPGKSQVVSICLNSDALNAKLKQIGLVDIVRQQGGNRLVSTAAAKRVPDVVLKISALSAGRHRIDLPVGLCCL